MKPSIRVDIKIFFVIKISDLKEKERGQRNLQRVLN
jgi:hypothetical protein